MTASEIWLKKLRLKKKLLKILQSVWKQSVFLCPQTREMLLYKKWWVCNPYLDYECVYSALQKYFGSGDIAQNC